MNYAETEEGMKKTICNHYPPRVLVGYSHEENTKKFIQVWYYGFHGISTEPCSFDEVDFNRFIQPEFVWWLDCCDRDEQDEFFRVNGFGDEFIRELEDFDLRDVARRIWVFGTKSDVDDGLLLLRLRDMFYVLAERIGCPVEWYFPCIERSGKHE